MDEQSAHGEDAQRYSSAPSTAFVTEGGDATLSFSQVDLNATHGATSAIAGTPDEDSTSDLEKGTMQLKVEIDDSTNEKSARARVDADLVSWDGPDDPANPMNWPMSRKWIVTWTVSLFTLMR